MVPTTGYLYIFTQVIRERLAGITGAYVDDTLSAGTDGFESATEITEERF